MSIEYLKKLKKKLRELGPSEVYLGIIILESILMLSMTLHHYYSEKTVEENETNTIEDYSFDTFEENQNTNIKELDELIPEIKKILTSQQVNKSTINYEIYNEERNNIIDALTNDYDQFDIDSYDEEITVQDIEEDLMENGARLYKGLGN